MKVIRQIKRNTARLKTRRCCKCNGINKNTALEKPQLRILRNKNWNLSKVRSPLMLATVEEA